MEKENPKKIEFSAILGLKQTLSEIKDRYLKEKFIDDYHRHIDNLETLFNCQLQEFRIKDEEILLIPRETVTEIISSEGKEHILGFMEHINTSTSTTSPLPILYPDIKYCERNIFLCKLNSLLSYFKKDIESLF